MKKLRCRDVGFDCDHEIVAESEGELMTQVVEHAKTVHGLQQVTPEVAAKVKSVIQPA